jgi:hypothetical protein
LWSLLRSTITERDAYFVFLQLEDVVEEDPSEDETGRANDDDIGKDKLIQVAKKKAAPKKAKAKQNS